MASAGDGRTRVANIQRARLDEGIVLKALLKSMGITGKFGQLAGHAELR